MFTPRFHNGLATALLLSLLLCSAAQAQSQPTAIDYNIPATRLSEALIHFSQQAGIEIIFDSSQLQGLNSNSLVGRHTLEQGFAELLKNTDWTAQRTNNGYVLRKIQPANTNALQLGPLVIQGAGNERDSAYQAPASVNIITRRDIERFRGTSVGDIFQGTPGVLIGENRNSGGLDVNIRGMQGQGRVPVLIDGSRQETTVYRGYAGVSSRSYIDPDLIGSIRIDKGPVMTAEGTGATGGVVSMHTLAANDIIKPGKDWGIRLRGSLSGNSAGSSVEPGTYAGYYLPRNAYRSDCRFPGYCTPEHTMPDSFASTEGMDRPSLLDLQGHSASLALARRMAWADLVIAYAERSQGNYYAGKHGPAPYIQIGQPEQQGWYLETPISIIGASPFRAGERIPNTQYSNTSWLVKSNVFLPKDQSLELTYLRYQSDFGEMMPSQIKGFGQVRQWLGSEVLNHTYSARYHWDPVRYTWADIKANFWHTDTLSQLNTPDILSVDIKDNTHRVDDYRRFGLDISNTSRFYPMGELSLSYGLALQREDMETDSDKLEGFYAGSRTGEREETSFFFAAQWRPWPQLTFDAGIRHTRYDANDNNPLPLSQISQFCDKDEKGNCLPMYYSTSHSGSAPIFAITWEPLAGLQFYARHAEALRMPSLFETTSGWSVNPALDIYLKPEHAKNRELGMNLLRQDTLTPGDRLAFKLAYFRNYTKDYLTRTTPNAWEDTQGFFAMRNIQGARFHGLEASLEYDAGWFFTQLSGTRYNHIEVCNVGSDVRYYCTNWGLTNSYLNNMIPPNWHAQTQLGFRLLQQKLELGLRGTFMGQRNPIPRYNARPGFNGVVQWHKYNLLDVFATYAPNDWLSIDFNIDNLTDRYYLDALSLGLVPAPGRTARLGLTLQF